MEFHHDAVTLMLTWARASGMVEADILDLAGAALLGLDDSGVFEDTKHGTGGFDRLYVGPFGIRAAFRRDADTMQAQFSLLGEACETVGPVQLLRFCCAAWNDCVVVKCTRLDLAWDGVPFDVGTVREACLAGNIRTKAKEARGVESRTLWGRPRDDDGQTVYIGSRASQRCVRVYDGLHGCVRVELQLREERADFAFWRTMVRAVEGDWEAVPGGEAEQVGRGLLVDFVEFIERKSDTNITRCGRLAWWSAFVEGVARVRQVIRRIKATVEAKIGWFEKTCATTFALVCEAMRDRAAGGLTGYLRELQARGERRLSPWGRVLLGELQAMRPVPF